MRVLVIGAGSVGSFIAEDLMRDFRVAVADRDINKLRSLSHPGLDTLILNASYPERVAEISRGFDIVVNALPGSLGFRVLKALIGSGLDVVDVSFMPEDPLVLRDTARSSGSVAIVDAGFAPGLSNIFIGHAYGLLEGLDEGVVWVGGLPKDPEPPLYHAVLFSVRDLIDEYLRPARMIKDGRIVTADPLSEVVEVSIHGFRLEAFPTDGLRTLLRTVRAGDLTEWTLRWPGHLSRMRVLKELGFLNKENLECSLRVLEPLMRLKGEDMSIMKVVGRRGGEEISYFLFDEGRKNRTSMARVTGSVASIITRLVAEGRIEEGLHTPEELGMVEGIYEEIVEGIRSRGIYLEAT